MGKHSKARKTQAGNLLVNLSNIGSKTKRAWDALSPKKIRKWLSPRKRHKENTMIHDESTEMETRIDASNTSNNPFHASDASDDPFDTSIQSFHVPGFTSESPSAAPATRTFTWKLPKPTVEEVDDEDDQLSICTFPPPAQPRPLFPPSSAPPSLPPGDSEECNDDPRDLIDVPETEDELLATSPSHDDEYPRPCAPRTFLDRMHEQAMRAGTRRQAPNLGEAKAALDCVQRYLRGELRGSDLWGR
ncbi:hypothetical protein B0H13DRAFT_2485038 [Mycena leptocephala]|nr:hypothetical protein B0H13DRAFT_2485038 [Mycena leptocephala]